MTLKDILQNGYGIDFSTLNFETLKGEDTCTKSEILHSMEHNELTFQDIVAPVELTDFDILDDDNETRFYCD